MNILAVGAHPDDIEVGCSAALLNYTSKGHSAVCVCMTSPNHIRYNEFVKSCSLMGCISVNYMADDTKLKCDYKTINALEQYKLQYKPDLVFAPYPKDTHQDHRNLSNAVLAAMRYSRNLLFYEGLTSIDFLPTVFFDIDDELYQKKLKVLNAHKSQVQRTNIEGISLFRAVTAMAIFRGLQGRTKYAEGFVPVRWYLT